MVAAWLFVHFADTPFKNVPLAHALGLGVVLGVGSVFGDLVESLFKREAGMKDSGSFFPSVGIILDILDSLLLNARSCTCILSTYCRHEKGRITGQHRFNRHQHLQGGGGFAE